MRIRIIILLLITICTISGFTQKQANVWYIGDFAGVDFNTGEAIAIPGISPATCVATMCDSAGNFLFSTNAQTVWNKNKEIMNNGENLIGHPAASQAALIVQKPGTNNIYYIFTLNYYQESPGLYYSVVDMNLDGGLGEVIEKNIPLATAWDAIEKLTAVKHSNGEDIWIITRKYVYNAYAAFLLTSSGINTQPVISYSPDQPVEFMRGQMKVSYDKKYLIAAYMNYGLPNNDEFDRFHISHFDASTGEINFMYTMNFPLFGNSEDPHSVEFSPDSKLAYLSTWAYDDTGLGTEFHLYQYDMGLIEDSAQFVESAILISNSGGAGLQLATDGKIYCSTPDPVESNYVNVIHDPWKRGTECNFEEYAVNLNYDGWGRNVKQYITNILLDYLYRFEWEGLCQSSPFVFQHNFQPVPEFISWNFGDPASGSDNFSNDLNPEHLFTAPGEYEVSVYVRYPSDRIEQTSRVVTVEDIPHPNLGPGYVVCEGEEVTLYAGEEEGFYVWSTGEFGQNLNQITVSDSGWYWVQVTAEVGCFGIDSVYVAWYPKAQVNEDNLDLVPTSCGGNNGMILGLAVSGEEPLSFEWYDADSVLVDTTLDLTDLPVGNYFLHIYDGNACTTISDPYTITDAGDIEISTVEKESAHCKQTDGEISIGANSGATDYLLYSIDNGNTWQANDSLFVNLQAGNYIIRVSDTSGCESVYENNPVNIENIAGPQVTTVTSVPEIDYLSNGEINITAVVNSGDVFYSIDNGTSFQTNNGLFNNLAAGTYYCIVSDDYECDTSFTVEVERIFSQLIEAIAGDGQTCIGNAAVVPLKLNNFTDIYKFHVKLTYDTSILNCDGYINVHPDLEDNLLASIIPGTDEVIVSWQGEVAVTLEENATMMELVFGAKEEGFTGIDWAASAGESAFYNENLEQVNAEYHLGILAIYKRPRIMMNKEEEYCEGDDVFGFVLINGGSGEIAYSWEGPGGYTGTGQHLELENVQTSQAGIYTLTVIDTLECDDSMELNLIINETPQIAFPDQDTIFAEPGFILEAGSGFESYLWNTGDTTDAIQINNEGLYSVFVISTESCKSTDSVTILWGGEPFWLPNAFTPNGDGLNDEFKAVQRYDFVKTYHLSIYSRWGEMIFETGNIEQGWDGKHKESIAPQGTYVYKISYTAYSTGDEQQSMAGHFTLVR